MKDEVITISFNPKDTYQRTYRIRRVNTKDRSMESTVPIELVQRQASKVGVTIEEFLRNYKIEWRYDGFDGILVRFVKDSND